VIPDHRRSPEIAKVITDMRFGVIAFTGFPEKGRLVASEAAKYLTTTILELCRKMRLKKLSTKS
jgi:acyl-CoA reductase-like NAD-dependent aldehyde dehydrogenase